MWTLVTVLPLILADKINIEIDVSKNYFKEICVAPKPYELFARKDSTLTDDGESFTAYMERKMNKDRWFTLMKNVQNLRGWMAKHKKELGQAELEELPSFDIEKQWIGSDFKNKLNDFMKNKDTGWSAFKTYIEKANISVQDWKKLINWIVDYEWFALYFINQKEDPVPKVIFTDPPLIPFDSKNDKATFEQMVLALL